MVCFVLLVPVLTGPVHAEEISAAVSQMEPVVVVGTVESTPSGKTVLDAGLLHSIPNRNGSLSEALTIVPGVQYSDEANNSVTAGEIRPPEISISGGRIFQNNFTVDGFSNNNYLDPNPDSPNSAILVQSHSQELFLNSRLFDNVTVYDSNIPAEFGSFTGGVIDADLIRPGKEFFGSVTLRTTRDSWTQFHIDPADQQAFENSDSESDQPNFEKYDFGTIFNIPLDQKSGVIFSYQQLYAKIPLLHFGEVKDQRRESENYLFKYGIAGNDADYAELSLIYAPYTGDYFRRNTMNSNYSVESGGLTIGGRVERKVGPGLWEAQVGYRTSVSSREAPSHLFGWNVTPSKPWGTIVGSSRSDEGMLGDLENSQKSWQIKGDLTINPFTIGSSVHEIKTGFDFEKIQGTYDRPETSYQYYLATTDVTVACSPGDEACIDGEQFFRGRFVFPKAKASADVNLIGLYVQDTVDIGKLQLLPGLRVSHDDFLKNTNLEPRFAASYDFFGNGRTRLIGGWNRYFGKTFLSYKLREALPPSAFRESRSLVGTTPGLWVVSSPGSIIYRFSEAETPYKDEFTLGAEQILFDGLLSLRYINRQGDDEFTREKISDPSDFDRYEISNSGRSTYEAYLLEWERVWNKNLLNINAAYQESTTASEDYADLLTDVQLTRQIWYEGELIYWDERPREDYSRPWVVNLTYTYEADNGFSFANITKYRSSYFALKNSGLDSPIDGNDIYIRERQPETVVFDWAFSYTVSGFGGNNNLEISAEIYNVFDRKTNLGDEDDEFELGRQFWLGAEYRF